MLMVFTFPVVNLFLLDYCAVCEAKAKEIREQYIFDPESKSWQRLDIGEERRYITSDEDLLEIERLISEGKVRKAEKKVEKYLKKHKSADRKRAIALLLAGDCAFSRGRFDTAHRYYKELIDHYPNSREYALAIRKDLEIAKGWLSGKKRFILGFIPVSAVDEAIEILDMIEQLCSGYRIAEVAVKLKADYYYKVGNFELALEEYRKLSRMAGKPEYRQYALRRAGIAALANFPGVEFDDTPLLDALAIYNEYLNDFPQIDREQIEEIIKQIEDRLAYKEYTIGRFYRRIGRPLAAKHYFEYVINQWPNTLWAEKSQLELEKMGFIEASSDEKTKKK